MTAMLLSTAVLVAAAIVAVLYGSRSHAVRPPAPMLDPRTERELRARYLNGQIGIDVYLDRIHGTTFSSTGDGRRGG